MTRHLTAAASLAVLLTATPSLAGAPMPTGQCASGGNIGTPGGAGVGSGSAPVCTYNNPTTSFGSNYRNTQLSAQVTAGTLVEAQCSSDSDSIPAQHMQATGLALSLSQPPIADDDKFLLSAGEIPAAIVTIDTSDSLMDFSTMPDVPGVNTNLLSPGFGLPLGCSSTFMEGRLRRRVVQGVSVTATWPGFGNTYYYGHPEGTASGNTPNALSDPTNFTYFACWQPITLDHDKAYRYRRWGAPQNITDACRDANGGSTTTYGYKRCVWCVSQPDHTVKNPETSLDQNVAGSGYGYYIVSDVRSASNNSVYWSGTVIDYPPMWIPMLWTGKFIANNAMTDTSGRDFLFPLRREVRTMRNSLTSGTCSAASNEGGNGMHPTCDRSNPYQGDSSFNSIFNYLDGEFNQFRSSTGTINSDVGLAGALNDAVQDYVNGGLRPTGNSAGWCSTCAKNHIIMLSAGETCHDLGIGTIGSSNIDASFVCSGSSGNPKHGNPGDCNYISPSCSSRGTQGNYTCGGTDNVWPNQVSGRAFNQDLLSSAPGQQNIVTDVIALGASKTALRAAAAAGGGAFLDASRDPDEIPDMLFSVLRGLIRASVSATSTPVNSVQASAGAQEELVALFTPKASQGIWDGHLYKYYFFSEFASGCVQQGQYVNFPDGASSSSRIQCPCLGGQCSGRYSVDNNLGFVQRANDGTFHSITYTQLTSFYTANSRYVTPEEALNYPLATPVWDVADKMAAKAWYNRKAYTVIDGSHNGVIKSSDCVNGVGDCIFEITAGASSTGVTTSVANALTPYLGIVGKNICRDLANLNVGIVYPDSGSTPYLSCAKGILNYALGKDMYNTNPGGNGNRQFMLGDIYHSTPIDIGPPTSETFCDFNLRRCTSTLFNSGRQTATGLQPLEYPTSGYTERGASCGGTTPCTADAYQQFVNRQTFAVPDGNGNFAPMPLVRAFGANDGWIHAIQFGCYVGVNSITGSPMYWGGAGRGAVGGTTCQGTTEDNGSEIWAFIPPDLLPKLALMALGQHQIFADLTPMVRDIYVGAEATKRTTDYKTIAVFGERNGGNRWFALDVTNPLRPQFRWMFPQIGSPDELRAGLSWGEYLPGSPPIGPVRMPTNIANSPTYNGTAFHETWVVMLPGGYDRYGIAGHGFNMIDVWTGEKYWEAWGATGMDFPFAALPAMTAWGNTANAPTGLLNNGFFDTAVIADTGGQVWVARFNNVPTRADNANGENLVNNWYVARAFRQANGDDDGAGPAYMMKNRVPFFTMPSLGRMADSGYLRTYLGSGDRGNVNDQYLGKCSAGNMLACGKQGAVTLAERDMDVGQSTVRRASVSFDGTTDANMTVAKTYNYNTAEKTTPRCTPASSTLNACVKGVTQASTVLPPAEPQQVCINTATGTVCSSVNATTIETTTAFNPTTGQNGSIANVYSTSGNGYYSGFYAITLFKPGTSRDLFTDATSAATYDAARVTEGGVACGTATTGLCNLYSSGVLSSYAFPETSSSFRSPTGTDGSSSGFYFRYPNIDERTSSNVLLSSGCVLWSTVQPTSPCESDADCAAFSVDRVGGGVVVAGQCNTAAKVCKPSTQCNVVGGSSAGHIWQTNAAFGTADCALVGESKPRVTFGTILPPPPPQSVALVNPGGTGIQYAVVAPAGSAGTMLQPRPGGGQLFRTFYDVEVPQALHSCRHAGNCPTNTQP